MELSYGFKSFRSKKVVKVISLLLVQCFLLYSTGFASIDDIKDSDSDVVKEEILSVENIGVPKDIGSVKTYHKGKSDKVVIHIQDAHCNYEAQANIAKMLESLIKDYNIDLVVVEGADGVVDTSWFKAFPDTDIRKEVADYFMKKGEITGVEFLSITSDYPFTIYGAEDKTHYIKNLNSFLESYPYKAEFQKYYTNIKSALSKIKKYVYTKELTDLDAKVNDHRDKDIKFADYITYLKEKAESKDIDIKDYKNFRTLTETLRVEKDINFAGADTWATAYTLAKP